jgi:tRNA-specific 2-thiouridylase
MTTSKISKSTSNKVFVGLSGGVDSAVSAALLLEQGFNVTGVFIKTWTPDFAPCTWRQERRDAMRVAARLGIPFLFFDFEEEYKRGVADYMIDEYRMGRTPNPDVMCNKVVKFGAFWQKAKSLGADFIATGHYAQVEERDSLYKLKEGEDKDKDQSYFLWTLTQEDLSHTLFPVGGLEKKEVRRLAKKFNLPVSDKKDSQGICFIGDIDMKEFLSHYVHTTPGDVLNVDGEIIGRHDGALLYTIGERHGFDIQKKLPDSKPFYVVAKDIGNNTITVSNDVSVISENTPKKARMDNVNWINEPVLECMARIRYRQNKFPVSVQGDNVVFSAPQVVASGQSIVFYRGDECLGGAILSL